jgi:hypothetical protein
MRQGLGCTDEEPAPLEKVAGELGITVIPADQLIDRRRLEDLQDLQPDAFSAATFRRPDSTRVIVFNPLHPEGRKRSNIAHEIVHNRQVVVDQRGYGWGWKGSSCSMSSLAQP